MTNDDIVSLMKEQFTQVRVLIADLNKDVKAMAADNKKGSEKINEKIHLLDLKINAVDLKVEKHISANDSSIKTLKLVVYFGVIGVSIIMALITMVINIKPPLP